ncbi:MAG: GNAT family N-acetyltransferase [Phreatobacter sp.]
MFAIETPRLILRPWESRDRMPFAAINADPEVRRYYYPSLLSAAESDALLDEAMAGLAVEGFGFLAVERQSDGALIGGAGLSRPGPEVPGGHQVELGWILGRAYWRRGYATEASLGWLDAAWRRFGLDTVIGYSSAINLPSRRAMERIGMRHIAEEDFDDITVPIGHVLRPHVLYRIDRPVR